MNVVFRSSFLRDLKKIKNQSTLKLIKQSIENIEMSESLSDIKGLKKLVGEYGYYRIKVLDYRIGIYFNQNDAELLRVLHRRDIYRKFP